MGGERERMRTAKGDVKEDSANALAAAILALVRSQRRDLQGIPRLGKLCWRHCYLCDVCDGEVGFCGYER